MTARVPIVDDLLRNLKLLEARQAEYFEVLNRDERRRRRHGTWRDD